MIDNQWKERYSNKIVTPEKALSHIGNGQTVFISTGCGEPLLLTEKLHQMAEFFNDVQIIYLLSPVMHKLSEPEMIHSFHCNTICAARRLEASSIEGIAEYTPVSIRELHAAFVQGVVTIDVALIHVSPPDSDGRCSLGISVDIVKAAVENAKIVIAQVNSNMPETSGQSRISADIIDYMVTGDTPLIEITPPELDPISLTIGRHISKLIKDGMTLHFDRCQISSAAMRYLDTKKDLGIHTDIFTDDYLRLIRSGAVTNRKKKIHQGKSVATIAIGSEELYRAMDNNPDIELYPIEYINDPHTISQNDDIAAVLSIQQIDLSGTARFETDCLTDRFSVLSSTDFIDGTRLSRNGIVIMAMPSTTADGLESTIVPIISGKGEYFSRTKVDVVVTEYGSISLYGRTVRERTMALISISHPRFRQKLLEEAKKLHYVDSGQIISPESGCIYPYQYEFTHIFPDGLEVLFRPVHPLDARSIQQMFYKLSDEVKRYRYHGAISCLSDEVAQVLSNIDYNKDMAILAVIGPRSNQQIIAEARYHYNPTNNMGDFDFLVTEDYKGRGIGFLLANYLLKIAYAKGLSGLYGEILLSNAAVIHLLTLAWPTAEKSFYAGICRFTVRFPAEDVNRPKDSIIIYSARFNDFSYGEGHPFKPDRSKMVMNVLTNEDYLKEPWIRIEEPKMISKKKLIESHNPDYIEALERASSGIWENDFLQYGLGSDECPIFIGMFDYIMLYTSATMTGVDFILNENANVVFNPLGGFHHAGRSHAEGFCYVNDIIIAIDTMLSQGVRVAYIDIDAHHGNGVQDAYYQDDRVLTVSLHQNGKTIYPWTGFENETGAGIGRGYNINIPLPEETDDEAYLYVFDNLITEAVTTFKPNVVVCVIGADTHKNDPLTNLRLTNNGMMEAIERIRNYSTHMLLLGGGGYDTASTTKAWARMWAAANRINAMPDYLSMLGGTFMGSGELKGTGIIDRAFIVSGNTKQTIMEELDRIIVYHKKYTMPVIKSRSL